MKNGDGEKWATETKNRHKKGRKTNTRLRMLGGWKEEDRVREKEHVSRPGCGR